MQGEDVTENNILKLKIFNFKEKEEDRLKLKGYFLLSNISCYC